MRNLIEWSKKYWYLVLIGLVFLLRSKKSKEGLEVQTNLVKNPKIRNLVLDPAIEKKKIEKIAGKPLALITKSEKIKLGSKI